MRKKKQEGFPGELEDIEEQMRAAQEAARAAKEAAQDALFRFYEPTDQEGPGTVSLTTTEIFQRLQQHMPSADYNLQDVAGWLAEAQFKTVDRGQLKLEWILKKRKA